jgi:hypothetical protein
MSFREKGGFGKDALNTKADKFFGLNKEDNSLKPQKMGWLSKKEAGSLAAFTPGGWRKRWVAVKDSFIFWYDSESKVGFDTKPRGCLPLGGAAVKILGDRLTIEVAHPAYPDHVLVLKSADPFDASEWVSIIRIGMSATWENAILGFALIEKMKAKGTTLEDEKDAALSKAQAQAERLRQERDESEAIANRKLETLKELEIEAQKANALVEEEKKKIALAGEILAKESDALLTEKMKRQALEDELEEVQGALIALDQALNQLASRPVPHQPSAASTPSHAASSSTTTTTTTTSRSASASVTVQDKKQFPRQAEKVNAETENDQKIKQSVGKLLAYFEDRNRRVQEEKRRMAGRLG